MTFGDLAALALIDIGIARAGDTLAPSLQDFALTKLDLLLDAWNVKPSSSWTDEFRPFAITPNLQNHTIGVAGSGATWIVPNARPIRILRANLVLNTSTPNVQVPIDVRDAYWWNNERVPTLTGTIPTDLYYEPDWPNGSCFLWPVPTIAYNVQLMLRLVLSQVHATDTVALPPGYPRALQLTLAEECASGLGQIVPPKVEQLAREARALIFDNNDEPRRLLTRDAGMPHRFSRSRTRFNYRSRSFR